MEASRCCHQDGAHSDGNYTFSGATTTRQTSQRRVFNFKEGSFFFLLPSVGTFRSCQGQDVDCVSVRRRRHLSLAAAYHRWRVFGEEMVEQSGLIEMMTEGASRPCESGLDLGVDTVVIIGLRSANPSR